MKADTILRGARLSACGRYRYGLSRTWDAGLIPSKGCVLFVMLNPSTADADRDDPTIRKCMGFARRWGHNAIEVVNLFAWRATDPDVMAQAECNGADIIGPDNDRHIIEAAHRAGVIVAAWGELGGTWVNSSSLRCRRVFGMLRGFERDRPRDVFALRLTKDGHPAHPARIPYGDPVPFEVRS